jgi:nitrate reductase cytochrome c-type subunit
MALACLSNRLRARLRQRGCAGAAGRRRDARRTPSATSRAAAARQRENKDVRRERAYSMQPPTIPHKIDNYQVDLNVNAASAATAAGARRVTQAWR